MGAIVVSENEVRIAITYTLNEVIVERNTGLGLSLK